MEHIRGLRRTAFSLLGLSLVTSVLAAPVPPDLLRTGLWQFRFREAGTPPRDEQRCITPQDLKDLAHALQPAWAAGCETGTRPAKAAPATPTWSAVRHCSGGRDLRADFTAPSAERLQGRLVVHGGTSTARQLEFDARWIGAECGRTR